MAEQRRSKKTDKIEVRLAPETKQAFHETCEQQGESASGVIRRLIEEYVARFHQPVIARPIEAVRRTPWWARWGVVAGGVALVAGIALQPSSAQARWQREFVSIDENEDGQFDVEDFLHRMMSPQSTSDEHLNARLMRVLSRRFEEIDADADGVVTRAEFEAHAVQELTDLFHALDADTDGAVQFAEFISPGDRMTRASVSGMASGTAFRQGSTPEEFDIPEETRWVMGEADTPPATRARLGQVFRGYDADDDGRILLQEFLAR